MILQSKYYLQDLDIKLLNLHFLHYLTSIIPSRKQVPRTSDFVEKT